MLTSPQMQIYYKTEIQYVQLVTEKHNYTSIIPFVGQIQWHKLLTSIHALKLQ